MTPILDIHHHGVPRPRAVTAVDLDADFAGSPFPVSVGLHPWNTSAVPCDLADRLVEKAVSLNAVAIGETGIDRLRGASAEIQSRVFTIHVEVARQLNLPVIIHSVRSADIILNLHRRLSPTTPWAIHGFRGNPVTATQLSRRGIYISLGRLFNADVPCSVDPRLLLAETDESDDPIEAVITDIAYACKRSPEEMTETIAKNTSTFLNL